jgi:hypothetical protein
MRIAQVAAVADEFMTAPLTSKHCSRCTSRAARSGGALRKTSIAGKPTQLEDAGLHAVLIEVFLQAFGPEAFTRAL